MFNQLVVRGDNLKRLKVAVVDKHGRGRYLRDNKPHEQKFSVFPLLSVTPKKEDDQPVFLKIICTGKITIKDVSLRRYGDAISRDFAAHQQKLQIFDFEDSELDKQFLLSTVSRDFEELVESLDENSEPFNRIVMSALMGPDIESHLVKGMLADRRIAKLYEALARMAPEAAEQTASQMFDESFEKYKTTWQRVDLLPTTETYARQAHLFLCSEFCGADLAMEKFNAWNNWVREQDRSGRFELSAGTDKLFAMNLQINMIRKKNNWSIDEINGFLADQLGPTLQLGGDRPPAVEWGLMRSSDWTSRREDIVTLVPVFSYTSALGNPARHEFIFETFRQELTRQANEKR